MGWLVRERRGISWKDQALNSISAPPLPLVVFFGLFIMMMFSATYSEFKRRIEANTMKLRFGLFMLPLVGILLVNVMLLPGRNWWRYAFGVRKPANKAVAEEGSSPWGLMLILGLVIFMVYYQASFQSSWFRSI